MSDKYAALTMGELRQLATSDKVAARALLKRCRRGMLVPYWEKAELTPAEPGPTLSDNKAALGDAPTSTEGLRHGEVPSMPYPHPKDESR